MTTLPIAAPETWTEDEEDILITSLESSESPVPYHSIQGLIPLHTKFACHSRYVTITTRPLYPDQLATIGRLWMSHQSAMFAHRARVCGVTVREYERISFCGWTSHPQSPMDAGRIDCASVMEDYRLHRREIWMVLSSQVMAVSWTQVEAGWTRNDGRLGRLMRM